MKLLPIIILAVAISVFAVSQQSAFGQGAGSPIGSDTVVYTFSNATQLNTTFLSQDFKRFVVHGLDFTG